jgi:ketosteroid isomerase-like protein
MRPALLSAVVLAVGVVSAQTPLPSPPGVGPLVEEERAFAHLSSVIGQAPAFLAYFADDVVTFGPLPGRGKAGLRAAAAKSVFPAVRLLDWEPWHAGISAAGDLGFTTGPARLMEIASGRVLYSGWFFSVWKHDAVGWRVAADVGTRSPAPEALRPHDVAAEAPPAVPRKGRVSLDAVRSLEAAFARDVAARGLLAAYEPYLAEATRLHRDGREPVVGERAVSSFLAAESKPAGWRVSGGGIAASGDLAYTYGEYLATPAAAGDAARSGFLHVWRRGGTRGWWLAADVVTR